MASEKERKEGKKWILVNDASEYEDCCKSGRINANRHLEFDPDNYRIVSEKDAEWNKLTENGTNFATNLKGEKVFVDGPHVDFVQGNAEGDETVRDYPVASTGDNRDTEGRRIHDWDGKGGTSPEALQEGKSGPAPGSRIEETEEPEEPEEPEGPEGGDTKSDDTSTDYSSGDDGLGGSADTQEPPEPPEQHEREPSESGF